MTKSYYTKILVRTVEDFVVIETDGNKFDATTAKTFRNEIAKYTITHSKFIVSLSEITFMDSTGLGALVWLRKKLREKHADSFLCLAGINMEILRLLQLVRMDKVFDQAETINAAMDLYRTGSKR